MRLKKRGMALSLDHDPLLVAIQQHAELDVSSAREMDHETNAVPMASMRERSCWKGFLEFIACSVPQTSIDE